MDEGSNDSLDAASGFLVEKWSGGRSSWLLCVLAAIHGSLPRMWGMLGAGAGWKLVKTLQSAFDITLQRDINEALFIVPI